MSQLRQLLPDGARVAAGRQDDLAPPYIAMWETGRRDAAGAWHWREAARRPLADTSEWDAMLREVGRAKPTNQAARATLRNASDSRVLRQAYFPRWPDGSDAERSG